MCTTLAVTWSGWFRGKEHPRDRTSSYLSSAEFAPSFRKSHIDKQAKLHTSKQAASSFWRPGQHVAWFSNMDVTQFCQIRSVSVTKCTGGCRTNSDEHSEHGHESNWKSMRAKSHVTKEQNRCRKEPRYQVQGGSSVTCQGAFALEQQQKKNEEWCADNLS